MTLDSDALGAGIEAVYKDIKESLELYFATELRDYPNISASTLAGNCIATLEDAVVNNFSELKISFARALLENVETFE